MSSDRIICLHLSSGETFEEIPLTDLDLKLGEFLDLTLKNLEVSTIYIIISFIRIIPQGECKLTLPETDEDLIDSRDFHVFSHDRSEEFSLTSQLKQIPYLCFATTENPPTLILESSIFRSAVEVDIDAKVDRRLGTEVIR